MQTPGPTISRSTWGGFLPQNVQRDGAIFPVGLRFRHMCCSSFLFPPLYLRPTGPFSFPDQWKSPCVADEMRTAQPKYGDSLLRCNILIIVNHRKSPLLPHCCPLFLLQYIMSSGQVYSEARAWPRLNLSENTRRRIVVFGRVEPSNSVISSFSSCI
jgi:hypothetical protein